MNKNILSLRKKQMFQDVFSWITEKRLNITGKDYELTDAIKNYIEEKVGKLTKYFGDEFDHFWFDFKKQNQIFSLFLNEIEQPNINYIT